MSSYRTSLNAAEDVRKESRQTAAREGSRHHTIRIIVIATGCRQRPTRHRAPVTDHRLRSTVRLFVADCMMQHAMYWSTAVPLMANLTAAVWPPLLLLLTAMQQKSQFPQSTQHRSKPTETWLGPVNCQSIIHSLLQSRKHRVRWITSCTKVGR